MNRLQKKCFIVATGMHLLLFVILLVGPAFLSSSSKPDDLQTITFIPANLIDKPFTGGGEKSPAPQPTASPQPPQQPPKAAVQLPAPVPKQIEQPKPAPTPKEQAKVELKAKPNTNSIEVKKPSQTKTKPPISTALVTHPKTSPKTDSQSDDAADAKRRADLAKQAARSLREGLSSSTRIETTSGTSGFGGGGEAYASYETAVRSIYEASWIAPDNTASDDVTAKITVTIANDGTVISSRITTPSGDAQTDASIQRTLDRVKFIAPFPPGAKDTQRTYIIPFNLKTKRLSA
jgi:TonB family C-terminal domain